MRVLLCLLLASGTIQAQPYPSRPVRMVVPARYEKWGKAVRDTGAPVN